jgi:hypothetical protein
MRWSGRGSIPLRRKPASATTIPKEKALLVKRCNPGSGSVHQSRGFSDLVADFAALAPAGLRRFHSNASHGVRLENEMATTTTPSRRRTEQASPSNWD